MDKLYDWACPLCGHVEEDFEDALDQRVKHMPCCRCNIVDVEFVRLPGGHPDGESASKWRK